MASVSPDDAYEFYEGLRADNSKTYWAAHKYVYDACVREPMVALLDELAPRFGGEVRVFRPYRDVRFAADKTPYKTAQGGVVHLEPGVGYWMQLDADGVRIGGGFRAQDKTQVARYRSSVDDDVAGPALERIIATLTGQGFTVGGDMVRTRPRGVAADHPRLDLIRHESLSVFQPVDEVTPAGVAAVWTKVRPLVDWALQYAKPGE